MPSDNPSYRQSVNTGLRLNTYYIGSNTCQMWQGLHTIMGYKGKPSRELLSDAILPDELNAFYARVEASNTDHQTPCTQESEGNLPK